MVPWHLPPRARRAFVLLFVPLALGGSPPRAAALAGTPPPPEFSVASYNLCNYTRMPRREGGHTRPDAPKPEREIAVILRSIRAISPDVLCVQEIGAPDSLADLRARLDAAGLPYPHAEHLEGPDESRRLALLSRFPIEGRHSRPEIRFELGGAFQRVRRGILDVTLGVNPSYRIRVIVLHLKSRRPAPGGQALIRRFESQMVRQHLERVLRSEPDVNLLLVGDLNDTKDQPPIQEIIGPLDGPMRMIDLPLEDETGDRWTQYWPRADSYDRIDYALASPGLIPEIVRPLSRIHRDPDWDVASDHRPLVVTIRPTDLPRPRAASRDESEERGPRVSDPD